MNTKNMKEEKDIFNKIVTKAKNLKLTEKERATLFARVDSYVKKNPIQASKKAISNEVTWFNYIFTNYSRAVSFALVVFIVLGGGTSLAAQSTLPGNILYPIKVNINEGIRSLFVASSGRANFEADRALMRLQEAEALAKKGALSTKAQIQLEGYFDAHLAKVEDDIQKYKENGELKKAFDASSKFESSLRLHEESLAGLIGIDGAETDDGLSKIVTGLQNTIVSSSVTREEVEQAIIASGEDNDDIRAIAESKLSDVKKLISNLNTNTKTGEVGLMAAKMESTSSSSRAIATSSNSQDDVSIWLEESNQLTTKGEEKIKQGLYKEAHVLFKKAYDVAEEAKILKDLHDSNSEDVQIDDLQ